MQSKVSAAVLKAIILLKTRDKRLASKFLTSREGSCPIAKAYGLQHVHVSNWGHVRKTLAPFGWDRQLYINFIDWYDGDETGSTRRNHKTFKEIFKNI